MARTKQTARRPTSVIEKLRQELEEKKNQEEEQGAPAAASEDHKSSEDECEAPKILEDQEEEEEEESASGEDDKRVYRIEVEIVGTQQALFIFSTLKRQRDVNVGNMTIVADKKPRSVSSN